VPRRSPRLRSAARGSRWPRASAAAGAGLRRRPRGARARSADGAAGGGGGSRRHGSPWWAARSSGVMPDRGRPRAAGGRLVGLPAYTAYAGLYDLLISCRCTSPSRRRSAFSPSRRPTRRGGGGAAPATPPALARRRARGAGPALRRALCLAQRPARESHGDGRGSAETDVASASCSPCVCSWASWRHIGPSLVVLPWPSSSMRSSGRGCRAFSRTGASRSSRCRPADTHHAGIFGIPALVSATFIFLFVVFGS